MISEATVPRLLLGVLCLVVLGPELRPAEPRPATEAPPDLRAAVKRVRPALMLLNAEHRERKFGVPVSNSTMTPFSGILFDPRGYILTVGQVIEGAEMISAEDHLGQIRLCEPIGYDPGSGVGVLRVSPPDVAAQELPEFVETAESEIGQPIFSLGNPFDLGTTLAVGHVTGTGRTLESAGYKWTNLLQLSLAVNPGDQGGPIVDYEGRVVGMVLTRFRPPAAGNLPVTDARGISFGLPLSDALVTARSLIEMYGQVTSLSAKLGGTPWLGVRVRNLDDPILLSQLRLDPERAVLVEMVFRNSPAELAGLEQNDVIVEFHEMRLAGLRHFGELISKSGAGTPVSLIVIRAGERRELELVIGERRSIGK